MTDTPTLKNEVKKNWNLYVLRLEHDKYYVGITTLTPEKRMQQHVDGFMGARWTAKHRPLEVMEQQNLSMMTKHEAELIENKKTRELMHQYGDNNVRGGDLSYRGQYFRRFGRMIIDKDWDAISTVILLLVIILMMEVLYFLKK